jgi:hypothetical protein
VEIYAKIYTNRKRILHRFSLLFQSLHCRWKYVIVSYQKWIKLYYYSVGQSSLVNKAIEHFSHLPLLSTKHNVFH